jgi:cytosine deaminase
VTPTSVVFANGRLNGALVDIAVDGHGVITSISPSANIVSKAPEEQVVDLHEQLVLPPLAEPHAHLDKAFLADRVPNPTGDLMGAIYGLEAIRESITFDDIVERSCSAVQLLSRNGVTAVRTHADTTLAGGLTPVLALLETKRRCADFINIEVAALLDWPLSGAEARPRLELARAAIEAGVDVIGGCPHLDVNPHHAIDTLLELAIEANLPLDLHADENLRPTSDDLEYVTDAVLRNNIQHRITASHCVSLSAQDPRDIARISEKVSAAKISVIALPLTNLFLQSRDIHRLAPRAITPTRFLSSAGANVAAGADNLQDPFNLLGRGDPLETAALIVLAGHETPLSALNMVTINAHRVINPDSSFLSVGDKADFIAVNATNVREAIAMGPPDRTVVYGGVVISEQKRNIK